MNVPSKLFEEVRARASRAIDEPNLELEARVTSEEKSLDRVGFERLVRYLVRTKASVGPPAETLDVGMGGHRVTFHDVNQISEHCARWSSHSLMHLHELYPSDMTVIRKEPVHKKVDLSEYNVLVWLKLESPVEDATDVIKNMSSPGRLLSFRLKKRYSFLSADGAFRVDCTAVKSASGAKSIDALAGAKERFEVEVELLDAERLDAPEGGLARAVAAGILSQAAELLAVLRDQRSGPILTASERARVLKDLSKLAGGRPMLPKPVTLERANLLEETPSSYSVRSDGPAGRYTVTDKADGGRYLLFVDGNGAGYLVDDGQSVFRTGISAPGAAMSLLDGELVRRSRLDAPISLYLVFDVYWARGKDVRHLPLVDLDGDGESRMRHMRLDGELGAALSGSSSPRVRAKEFFPREQAKAMYDRCTGPAGAEYAVDGLILTPERLGVFQDRPGAAAKPRSSTWGRVFKWKPPKDNSVDFRVQYEKTSNSDIVFHGGRARARLQVGVREFSRGADPYTILTGGAFEHQTLYRAFEAPDYGLSVPGDPDSVGPGMFVHPGRDLPRCAHPPHDTVLDESIVEFSWDLARGAWVPLRVRHDKVYPNKHETALSVWRSIAFPVSLEDVADPSRVTDAGAGAKDDVYFDEVTAGDGASTESMRRFHRSWIIDAMLYGKAAAYLGGGGELRLLDLACGRGGDLNSWISNGFGVVVGVDLFEDNLIGQTKIAAYARLARAKSLKRNADLKLRYAFVPLDASKKIDAAAVEDIANPSLKRIGQSLWRSAKSRPDPKLAQYDGLALKPFDVVSCQFALHYFFESEDKLDRFLDNVAENLRPGGLFIGTCTDGFATAEELRFAERDAVKGTAAECIGESGNVVWRIEKRYDGDYEGKEFGVPVAVYIETINKVNTEYLVDFEVVKKKLAKRGMRLLDRSELDRYGVGAATAMFSDVYAGANWNAMSKGDDPFLASLAKMVSGMSDDLKRFSFLNRYFLFTKD